MVELSSYKPERDTDTGRFRKKVRDSLSSKDRLTFDKALDSLDLCAAEYARTGDYSEHRRLEREVDKIIFDFLRRICAGNGLHTYYHSNMYRHFTRRVENENDSIKRAYA